MFVNWHRCLLRGHQLATRSQVRGWTPRATPQLVRDRWARGPRLPRDGAEIFSASGHDLWVWPLSQG